MNSIHPLVYLLIAGVLLILGYAAERIARRGRERAVEQRGGGSQAVGPAPTARRRRMPLSHGIETGARSGIAQSPTGGMRSMARGANPAPPLSHRKSLRQAIVAMTVLGPPRSRQQRQRRAPWRGSSRRD